MQGFDRRIERVEVAMNQQPRLRHSAWFWAVVFGPSAFTSIEGSSTTNWTSPVNVESR